MSLHAALRSALLSLPAVAAIVGSGSAARIRPGHFEKTDGEPGLETVLVEVDRRQRENDLAGRGGLVVAEVTLTCRASTLALAETLAEAVRSNNTSPGTGLAGYTSATLDLVLDDDAVAEVPKGDASEAAWHDVVMSFTAIYGETP